MALFKDRLKELRLENELTLKELGQKLGYSESTMFMYESGECSPKTTEDYERIANLFHVPTDFLLGSNDSSNITELEAAELAEEFLDMLIECGKIKSVEDLNPENIFSILDEIFKEIEKDTD